MLFLLILGVLLLLLGLIMILNVNFIYRHSVKIDAVVVNKKVDEKYFETEDEKHHSISLGYLPDFLKFLIKIFKSTPVELKLKFDFKNETLEKDFFASTIFYEENHSYEFYYNEKNKKIYEIKNLDKMYYLKNNNLSYIIIGLGLIISSYFYNKPAIVLLIFILSILLVLFLLVIGVIKDYAYEASDFDKKFEEKVDKIMGLNFVDKEIDMNSINILEFSSTYSNNVIQKYLWLLIICLLLSSFCMLYFYKIFYIFLIIFALLFLTFIILSIINSNNRYPIYVFDDSKNMYLLKTKAIRDGMQYYPRMYLYKVIKINNIFENNKKIKIFGDIELKYRDGIPSSVTNSKKINGLSIIKNNYDIDKLEKLLEKYK